jgi:MFS family permease
MSEKLIGKTPDLLGVLFLMVGVASLAFSIVQADNWGYTHPVIWASGALAIGLIIGLVRRSAHHTVPILHLPLFRDHDFRLGSGLSFLIAGTFAGSFLALIQLLNQAWGLSLLQSGLAFGMIPAIAGPMSVVSGRLADRFGHRAVILPGSLCMATAGIWMYTQLTDERQLVAVWIPFVAIYAMGVGLAHAACQSAALTNVENERLGIGGAMNRIFQEIGSTVCAAIVIAILAATTDVVAGVRSVMILLIVASLAGTPAAARLRARGSNAVS